MKKIIIALITILALSPVAIRLWNASVLADGYVGDGLTILMEQEVQIEDGPHQAILMAHRDGVITLSYNGERLMTHKFNLWTEPISREKEIRDAQAILSIYDDPYYQGNAELGGGLNQPGDGPGVYESMPAATA